MGTSCSTQRVETPRPNFLAKPSFARDFANMAAAGSARSVGNPRLSLQFTPGQLSPAADTGGQFFQKRTAGRRRRAVAGDGGLAETPRSVSSPASQAQSPSICSTDEDEQLLERWRNLAARTQSHCDKSPQTTELLRESLTGNPLFAGRDEQFLNGIIDVCIAMMERRVIEANQVLLKQGDEGNDFYVVEHGRFDILVTEEKDGQEKLVAEATRGESVGEFAIMYNIPRAATLRATEQSIVWSLSKQQFREIRGGIIRLERERIEMKQRLLQNVPLFSHLSENDLFSFTQAMKEVVFEPGQVVIDRRRQPDDSIFIIAEGSAIVERDRRNSLALDQHEEMFAGDYFAHNLFDGDGINTVTAVNGLKAFRILRRDFDQLMAYDFVHTDSLKAENRVLVPQVDVSLDELEVVRIIGTGSFGAVKLVLHPRTGESYALKCVSKSAVVRKGQQDHIQNERQLMAGLNSSFCVNMLATFQDQRYIYFLLELVQGGELFRLMRREGRLSEDAARFFAACVVLAIEHMHSMDILYRDLKPENLLIAKDGYLKLTDFGFAKKRDRSATLCGTPEYMAPEVIEGGMQSFAVDWWSLGVLLFEMICGEPPFVDDAHFKSYQKICAMPVRFPNTNPKVSVAARSLITRLLAKNAFDRLGSGPRGAKEVMEHPFFQDFDWEALRNHTMQSPFVPTIESSVDVSHFENFERSSESSTGSQGPTLGLDDAGSDVWDWAQEF